MSEQDQPLEEPKPGTRRVVAIGLSDWEKLQELIQKNQNGIETAVVCLLGIHFSLPEISEYRVKTRKALVEITGKDPEVLLAMVEKRKAAAAAGEQVS